MSNYVCNEFDTKAVYYTQHAAACTSSYLTSLDPCFHRRCDGRWLAGGLKFGISGISWSTLRGLGLVEDWRRMLRRDICSGSD